MNRKILTAITTIIALIFICAPPFIVYARRSQIHENANLIRYTQLLLSRNGSYSGPIDGQCNTQTQQAIEKYKDLPPATPSGEICRIQFLEDLNGKLAASMSAGPSESHDIVSQNTTGERNLASIPAEIDKLKSDLSNTTSMINRINEGISGHFISLTNSMATIGMSAIFSITSVVVSILIIGITSFVKAFTKNMEDLHKEATTNLSKMIDDFKNESLLSADRAHDEKK